MANLPPPGDVDNTTGGMPSEAVLVWLETSLPQIMRRLMDAENLELPLFQLPLAQMRLAYGLFPEADQPELLTTGETMGRLSDRLGVRQNALTQAADRLVRHGLAERLSDPNDRRIVRLRLTATGAEWVRERRERRRRRLGALWAELDETERGEFLHAVNVLQAIGERIDARPQMDLEGNCLSPESSHHGVSARGAIPTIEETLERFTIGAANEADARIVRERTGNRVA